MQSRTRTLLISLALIAAGSSAAEGKHSWLMAQDQTLTQAQIHERCESIRRAMMGDDATGRTSGLMFQKKHAEDIIALLQKYLDETQEKTIPLEVIKQRKERDLQVVYSRSDETERQTLLLTDRDLDYWTRREAIQNKEDVSPEAIRAVDGYPIFCGKQSLKNNGDSPNSSSLLAIRTAGRLRRPDLPALKQKRGGVVLNSSRNRSLLKERNDYEARTANRKG